MKDRILAMEALYKASADDPERADELLKELSEIYARMTTLATYQRDHWLEDFEWEKEHPIPLAESTTGVLSEDGLYNHLANEHDRAVALIELGLSMLKAL